jgi:hypothetical protein
MSGRRKYSRVLPGAPRGLLMALLSPPQCHAALCTMPNTVAWVNHRPACPPIHVTRLCDRYAGGWSLEGLAMVTITVLELQQGELVM